MISGKKTPEDFEKWIEKTSKKLRTKCVTFYLFITIFSITSKIKEKVS